MEKSSSPVTGGLQVAPGVAGCSIDLGKELLYSKQAII